MAKTDSSNRWQRPNGQIQGIIVYCSLKNGGIAIISPAVKKDRWIVQVAKTDSSNLNPNDWNVWYHLGLSYFLLGMYDKADWAYTRCAALNKTADDICAVTDWHYMTLKRLGKDEEAAKLLDEITEDMPVSDEVANSYYQRLRVYKGLRAPETLFTNAGDGAGLDVITQGFGVANYYRMNGQEEKGVEMLKKVVYTAEHSKWYAAFGCLAARVDLKNIGQA